MMPRPGWRELANLPNAEKRKCAALENFLNAKKIPFSRRPSSKPGHRRYLVLAVDLNCAQSVLPAIKELAEDPKPPEAA